MLTGPWMTKRELHEDCTAALRNPGTPIHLFDGWTLTAHIHTQSANHVSGFYQIKDRTGQVRYTNTRAASLVDRFYKEVC